MKKLLGLAVFLVFFSLPTFAQYNESKVEVGGGYTFRSFQPSPVGDSLPNPRHSSNGWNATVAYNVNDWFTIATDVDGTRDDEGANGLVKFYTVLVGPRVYPFGHHKLAPFAHVMFGLAHFNSTLPNSSNDCAPFCTLTDGSFAVEAGGGVDLNLTKHFAVRLGEFDYERTSFLSLSNPPLSATNNNYKYRAAILFRF
ncbi:MAG: outer membrane beta-barrel protein [Candidatus Acidiferrales bacterium]